MKRRKKTKRTIIDAMLLPSLFGPWFVGKDSWKTWIVAIKALLCLPMDEEELKTFQRYTNRNYPPTIVREFWAIVGRRGGKSLIAALIAVYLACFRDYSQYLAPGEVGTVMVIAADRKQARVVLRYAKAFIKEVPTLSRMIQNETKESIELTNRVVIEVHTASYTTTRGYTLIAVIADEVAYWPSEDSASPDTEIIEALRPGMATIPNSLLICISSPYSRRGALWEAYKEHFGKDSPALIWQADSASMNPTLNRNTITEAYERDESKASAEWGARFRSDLESYVTKEVVSACTFPSRIELPFSRNFRYHGFTDPAGGSGRDSFTLAIAHNEKDRVILDATRERKPPFSPESVIEEYAGLLKSYSIRMVTGDRYAGEFPREMFRRCGIDYETSEFSRSEIYVEFLPLLNSSKVEFLDNPRLQAQFVALERRTGRGADIIDHPPNGNDDVSNAAAGALLAASKVATYDFRNFRAIHGPQRPLARLLNQNRGEVARIFSQFHKML